MASPVSEPLQDFSGLAEALAESVRAVDAAQREYLQQKQAGRILSNSVEALRIELTYHSNAIEGSTLTLRETQLVIEGHAPTSGRTLREVYEARNHDRALRAMEGWIAARPPSTPLTEQHLLAIHAHVLADIDPASAGRFRSERVLIKGTRYIPPGSHRFADLVPGMLDLAARPGAHPVLQAAEMHYNLVAIHPFTDGNGRTARLIMNHHLLRHGYPLAIVEFESRAEYLASLEEANGGRCKRFAALMLRSAERSIRRLIGPD